MTLPAFAAERGDVAAGRPSPAAVDRYLLPARRSVRRRTPLLLSNGGTERPTDRRTEARPFHGPCFAYYAGNTNNDVYSGNDENHRRVY